MADQITVEFLDGRRVEFTTRTHMCQADRIAFERRFDTSVGSLAGVRSEFDEAGQPKAGADLSALKEEYLAFFVWRCMNREIADQGRFEDWVETVAEVEFGKPDQEADDQSEPAEPAEAPRPTVPATA